jgi:hypothetical protein
MNPLIPCVVLEGTCPQHGFFRRVARELEISGMCPTCRRGPVELKQIGQGFTRRALPYYEATTKIFEALKFTTPMPNSIYDLKKAMGGEQ